MTVAGDTRAPARISEAGCYVHPLRIGAASISADIPIGRRDIGITDFVKFDIGNRLLDPWAAESGVTMNHLT